MGQVRLLGVRMTSLASVETRRRRFQQRARAQARRWQRCTLHSRHTPDCRGMDGRTKHVNLTVEKRGRDNPPGTPSDTHHDGLRALPTAGGHSSRSDSLGQSETRAAEKGTHSTPQLCSRARGNGSALQWEWSQTHPSQRRVSQKRRQTTSGAVWAWLGVAARESNKPKNKQPAHARRRCFPLQGVQTRKDHPSYLLRRPQQRPDGPARRPNMRRRFGVAAAGMQELPNADRRRACRLRPTRHVWVGQYHKGSKRGVGVGKNRNGLPLLPSITPPSMKSTPPFQPVSLRHHHHNHTPSPHALMLSYPLSVWAGRFQEMQCCSLSFDR